jgi:hypothetical protein
MSDSKKQEIFGAAMEIADKAQRTAMLDSACAGDPQLRAQVQELIETSGQAEGFFDECATAITSSKEELDALLGGKWDCAHRPRPRCAVRPDRLNYRLVQTAGGDRRRRVWCGLPR